MTSFTILLYVMFDNSSRFMSSYQPTRIVVQHHFFRNFLNLFVLNVQSFVLLTGQLANSFYFTQFLIHSYFKKAIFKPVINFLPRTLRFLLFFIDRSVTFKEEIMFCFILQPFILFKRTLDFQNYPRFLSLRCQFACDQLSLSEFSSSFDFFPSFRTSSLFTDKPINSLKSSSDEFITIGKILNIFRKLSLTKLSVNRKKNWRCAYSF